MKKLNNKWMVFIAIQVMFLVVGTFIDLNLSHTLYNRGSFYSELFKIVGELPLPLMATLAAIYKGRVFFKTNRIKAVLNFVLAGLFALMSSFQVPMYLGVMSVPMSIGIFVVIYLAMFMIVKTWFKERNEKLLRYASLVIFVAFMNIFVINVIKQFWGRKRYWLMFEENNFTGFSRWFIPQGMAASDAFKSFPSGHSANASIVMLLALFPFKKEGMSTKVFIIAAVYTVLVQISRIVDGAHFLSDVSMGVIVGLLMIYLGSKIFIKDEVKTI